MSTKLIQLQDGTLVEIESLGNQTEEISGGVAEKVSATVGKIEPILLQVLKPISSAWKEINKDMCIEKAEIELGLSFEIEGNIYVTKSTANANLVVKLILKPKPDQQNS